MLNQVELKKELNVTNQIIEKTVKDTERNLLLEISHYKDIIDDLQKIIAIQADLIGSTKQTEFFCIKGYRGKPIIYKDGNLIECENATDVTVTFSPHCPVTVSVDLE